MCAVFVSWLELPVLTSLHTGDGFWTLAPDATKAQAAATATNAVDPSSASPTFVRALAWWFDLVGAAPASALLFNVLAYALASWLIVRLGPGPEPPHVRVAQALSLAGLAFSLALILSGAQVLKDITFALLIVTTCVSAHLWLRGVARRADRPAAFSAGLLLFSLAGESC